MAGIYLHIPFCKQACYYCDFHFSTSVKRKSEMVDAIVKELEIRKLEITEPIETIYFGGGTPSLLSESELSELIETIQEQFTVISTPEITLEANPDDLSETNFERLKEIGINRLSIGIQSFFEDDLKAMNRAHKAKESLSCLEQAKKHFDNITIDLIYGIPTMTNEQWLQNLNQAFQLEIPHISSYALTVEPKTALESFIKKGKYPSLKEQQAASHFDILVEETGKQGFVHYEISNFGKEGYFSKHNTSYWKGIPYLGVGPSAHSFNGTHRSWNIANNAKYIKSIANNELPSTIEKLSLKDRYNEYVMTGLRTIWGVDLEKVKTDFDQNFYTFLTQSAEPFIEQMLLEVVSSGDHHYLKTTAKGKFLADGLASELFMI